MNKKRDVVNLKIFLIIMLFITIPLVSANFLDLPSLKIKELRSGNLNIRDWITGKATTATTEINITIGNTAPTISNVSSPGSPSVSAGTYTWINFSFVAIDLDGASNLNNATASGRYNISTDNDYRFNSSCKPVGSIGASQTNFSCSIQIWYFDTNGGWTINASIKDNAGAYAENISSSFTLGLTTAMNMTPSALTWPAVGPTSTNTLANQNITIWDIANKNITADNVNVTAFSLQGETTTSDYLNASNFTVSVRNACDSGNVMISNKNKNITSSNITIGNVTGSVASANTREELFFCLEDVTAGISQQSYSTTGSGSWTVEVI